MLGRYRQIADRPLTFLGSMNDEFGPVAQLPIPSPPTFLVGGAHAAREVLQAQSHLFDKDTLQYRSLALVTGEGLLAATEDAWRVQRPIVQPAFHQRVLARFAADVGAATERLAARWRLAGRSVVDAEAAMLAVGMEVVGRHLFRADMTTTAGDLADATLVALESVVAAARPPWGLLPAAVNPRRRRFDAALAELDAAVAAVIAAHPGDGDDLLGLLLQGGVESPQAWRFVRDQVTTFMVAGHETVASSLTWTIGLLAGAPEVQMRLQREVDEVTGGAPPGHVHLPLMRYTRAVVDEGLRLYPPAWIITRSARSATVLRGRRIPAGALLLISPYVEHRDPHRWPEPLTFDPDRFLDSRPAARPGAISRAATARADYLPFGTGPRLCIGRDMALVESVLVLARLAQEWSFDWTAPLPQPATMVTLRPPQGLPVRLNPRW